MSMMDRFLDKMLPVMLALMLVFVAGVVLSMPMAAYKQNACSAHCGHAGQLCASWSVGTDEYVCADPGERNVNLDVK